MLPGWLASLSTPFQGASASDLHFGPIAEELALARDATVVAPLAHLDAIEFAGEDTVAFLQGQLSSDLRQVTPEKAQYSSYSTPKGRMLASFLLYRDETRHVALVSAEIREAMQKRLGMFILRSKVKAAQAGLALFGLAGAQAEAMLNEVFGAAPAGDLDVVHRDGTSLIRLPHLGYLIAAPLARADEIWRVLAGRARPVGAAAWSWLEVNSGVVRVGGKTQELFVPQMANYDLIGGVSFTKGCYPGQEIVARTQYLGKVKRRAFLARVAAAAEPGQAVYSPDLGEQASGHVANAAPNPDGGWDVLAVVNAASLEHGVHLGAPDGPLLEIRSLPYATP